ncbi:dihydroorotate dehydrogenase [Clostridia bacterium]|nr:dihydroorotate dehydrogenase [Clostridia bacterium]
MAEIYNSGFFKRIKIGGKLINGRFVIPSGIRCAKASAIEQYFAVPEIGVITTKSVSAAPKIGYLEPIYARYAENCYINAVGLENPGAQVFAGELSKIRVPLNKFLLISVFGGTAEDFLNAALPLYPYADGFELNLSCPHAKGYGLQVGSDTALVSEIITVLKSHERLSGIPILAKLSAAVPNLAQTAKTAVDAGADGIVVTNSFGPAQELIDGEPVLYNKVGGLSGEGIRPVGIKAVRDVREAVGDDKIVIGMGGVFTAQHVDSYFKAGADLCGVGSALTGLSFSKTAEYFGSLEGELTCGISAYTLPAVKNMSYTPSVIESREEIAKGLFRIKFTDMPLIGDTNPGCASPAGRFYFLMIPGVGEKPFAVYNMLYKEFIVRSVGCFSKALTEAPVGTAVYIRGAYGAGVPKFCGVTVNIVAGGTGIGAAYEIGRYYTENMACDLRGTLPIINKVRFFFGVKEPAEMFDIELFAKVGRVYISAENPGDSGFKHGLVTDLMDGVEFGGKQVFVNVGPAPMIDAVTKKEAEYTSDIYSSYEYHTSCGVGICGKCADPRGNITCVDGPFLKNG